MGSIKSWVCGVLLAAGVMAAPASAGEGESPRPGSKSAPAAVEARELAARIDAALAAEWAKAKIRPAAVADDGEFLRRASLDVIGKIPTAAEARDFLDDPGREKRQALIERLLDGPAYITRATELWRQLLLPEADTEDQARQVAGSFEAWLRRKVAEEAGYDRIVREILNAKLDDRNRDPMASRFEPSPTAYYVAKEGKPEHLAAGASRVFLGVRLECAQCHNHPFARWKRDDFWGFAAFFAGVPTMNAEEEGNLGARTREAASKRELKIPGTDRVIQAAHLDGSTPAWRPRAESREILAEWITAPENPYFARAIVNRVWARFFGSGLLEPIDDLDMEADPERAKLLDELAVQFRLHGYDLKYLIRVLTATQAYSLSSASSTGESSATASAWFAAMPVRGLSPGQLFDSLSRATGVDGGEMRGRLLELFANRDERSTEAQTTILQALTMMNGGLMAGATNPETGPVLGAVAAAPFLDAPSRIETLYLATLTRRPRPEELALLVRYVEQRGEGAEARAQALADVFWAVLNGPEFHLNH